MRVEIQSVESSASKPSKVTLIYKPMEPQWVKPRPVTKQYKKVGD